MQLGRVAEEDPLLARYAGLRSVRTCCWVRQKRTGGTPLPCPRDSCNWVKRPSILRASIFDGALHSYLFVGIVAESCQCLPYNLGTRESLDCGPCLIVGCAPLKSEGQLCCHHNVVVPSVAAAEAGSCATHLWQGGRVAASSGLAAAAMMMAQQQRQPWQRGQALAKQRQRQHLRLWQEVALRACGATRLQHYALATQALP